MSEDIYYENVNISYKTVDLFEKMYIEKKEEIIDKLIKNIKEKYNIDIITNGSESNETLYFSEDDVNRGWGDTSSIECSK